MPNGWLRPSLSVIAGAIRLARPRARDTANCSSTICGTGAARQRWVLGHQGRVPHSPSPPPFLGLRCGAASGPMRSRSSIGRTQGGLKSHAEVSCLWAESPRASNLPAEYCDFPLSYLTHCSGSLPSAREAVALGFRDLQGLSRRRRFELKPDAHTHSGSRWFHRRAHRRGAAFARALHHLRRTPAWVPKATVSPI